MFLTEKLSWTDFDRVAFAYSRNTTVVDNNIKSRSLPVIWMLLSRKDFARETSTKYLKQYHLQEIKLIKVIEKIFRVQQRNASMHVQ